jgi:hypothetical protein
VREQLEHELERRVCVNSARWSQASSGASASIGHTASNSALGTTMLVAYPG